MIKILSIVALVAGVALIVSLGVMLWIFNQ